VCRAERRILVSGKVGDDDMRYSWKYWMWIERLEETEIIVMKCIMV
jgi:hypothetical protein